MFDLKFSVFPLLLVVGFVATAIAIISLLKKYYPAIAQKYRPGKPFKSTWIYGIELLIVLTLLAVSVGFLYQRNFIASMALVLVLLLTIYYLSSSFIKNYLNGLLIKSSGQYKTGDKLVVDTHTGKISRLGTTHLHISNAEGQTVYIPYSWIYPRLKTIQKVRDKINGYHFMLKIEKTKICRNTPEHIKQFIAQTPWVHPNFDTEIELADSTPTENQYNITVYALSKVYCDKIQQSVQKYFEKKPSSEV